MEWISTKDKLPEKSGKYNYEHVECLVIRGDGLEILMWNCEENYWDNEEGDDFECAPLEVEYYITTQDLLKLIPYPEPPKQ